MSAGDRALVRTAGVTGGARIVGVDVAVAELGVLGGGGGGGRDGDREGDGERREGFRVIVETVWLGDLGRSFACDASSSSVLVTST